MPTNLVQNGERISRTIVANVTAGKLYPLAANTETGTDGLPTVAAKTGVTGATIEFITEGVFTLTKLAGANTGLDQGDIVYWKTTGGENKVTGLVTASGGIAGTAWAAATTGATTAVVKLLGQGGWGAV